MFLSIVYIMCKCMTIDVRTCVHTCVFSRNSIVRVLSDSSATVHAHFMSAGVL